MRPCPAFSSSVGQQCPCFRTPGSAAARAPPGTAAHGRIGRSGRRWAAPRDDDSGYTSIRRRRRSHGHRPGSAVREGRRTSRHWELIRHKREAPAQGPRLLRRQDQSTGLGWCARERTVDLDRMPPAGLTAASDGKHSSMDKVPRKSPGAMAGARWDQAFKYACHISVIWLEIPLMASAQKRSPAGAGQEIKFGMCGPSFYRVRWI